MGLKNVRKHSQLGWGLMLCVMITLQSCSKPKLDLSEVTDNRIDKAFESLRKVDAQTFFKNGGTYIDFAGDPPFDRPYVVPLITTLTDEFHFEWLIFTLHEDPQQALELVAEIPPGTDRKAVQLRLSELQEEFPGDILQEWGDDYFSLDFNNVEESEYFRVPENS
ncbi:hypothetical protein AB1L42_04260 [Thalassoglobus sp. JC818]|uniref:hypothetical protein n=1 Tax=Thalassoglobus sp. JC818 TaxID=3232136 RepID=UPI00345AA879